MINNSDELTNPEYCKMLSGEYYNRLDPYLVNLRNNAELLYREYNTTYEMEIEKRNEIYSKLFGKFSDNLTIKAPFYCVYGINTYLGENIFMNLNCFIIDCAKVTIGDNTLLGPNVHIYTAGHTTNPKLLKKDMNFAKEIVIGRNVWIGGGAILNPGVTIGDNSVIGSGSVVTKDIPSNCVAVGNPCKVIKYLDEELIE